MITYPNDENKFTIDDFRIDGGLHTADYYIHVVNDETSACTCLLRDYDFERTMKKYKEYKKECAAGWHIEVTVGISQGEVRARVK